MALDSRTCADSVSEYTLSEDGYGHLAMDQANRFRAEVRNHRIYRLRGGTNGRYQTMTSRQSGDCSKVKG